MCTIEVAILGEQNVMNSQNTDTFQRKQSVFQSCLDSGPNFFPDFCLYPPNEDHMPFMCQLPSVEEDPTSFFARMQNKDFFTVVQLPSIISYPRFSQQEDWVNTDLWPGLALGPVTNLQDFATSNNNPNLVSIGVIGGIVYVSNNNSLFLPQPLPISLNTPFFNAVNINSDGSVRVALLDSGAYLWTLTSNNVFEPIVLTPPPLEPTIVAYTNLLMWENTSDTNLGSTYFAITLQTPVAMYIYLYLVLSPSYVATSYKNIRVNLAGVNSAVAWCVLTSDERHIYFAHTFPLFNSFVTYTVTTAFTDLSPAVAHCSVTNVTSFSLRKYYASIKGDLFVPSFQNVTVLDSQDHILFAFTFNPATVPVVPFVTTAPSLARIVQRKSAIVFALESIVVLNDQGLPNTPFPVNSLKDVYAITPDASFIHVLPQNDPKYYQIAIPNGTQWTTRQNLFLSTVIPHLDETLTGLTQWFLGTTFGTTPVPPNPDGTLLLSQHSILRLNALDNDFVIQQSNVPEIIQRNEFGPGPPRITRLYNDGEIRIFQAENDTVPLWQSFTNDQEGSPTEFATLAIPLQHIAVNTLGAVSSPNGRYLLVVYNDRVDLLFNPFNAPRFTQWTNAQTNPFQSLQASIAAQSQFCFLGLNNIDENPLVFIDDRCTCLPSEELVKRVYGANRLAVLPTSTQTRLLEDTPCIMRDCQLDEAEYSNASINLGTRCVVSTGVCAQYVEANVENFLVTQNCGLDIRSCVTSENCPFGSNCRNGQCVTQCTTDALCRTANPLAKCINGQCQVPLNSSQTTNSTKNELWWLLVVLLALALFALLIVIVYYSVRTPEYQQKKTK